MQRNHSFLVVDFIIGGVFMKQLLDKKLLVYEVIPPKGPNISKSVKLCEDMKSAGAEVIAITDLPVGKVRSSPWALAKILLDMGTNTLVHFNCRTRNALRIEADLIGMYILGIENILILSGDNPEGGDYPFSTVIEDFSVYEVINLTKKLNDGTDSAGNKLNGKTDFFTGAVFSLSEKDFQRARKKIESGVDFFVSQPVFEMETLFKIKNEIPLPVLISVAFFKSKKQLLYFSKIPGINIPEDFLMISEDKTDSYVKEYTLNKVLEFIEEAKKFVWGFYVSGIVKDVEGVRKIAEVLHS